MDWIRELRQAEHLNNALNTFLDQYGLSGLENALNHYSAIQSEYICKTETGTTKIKIADIHYLEIRVHTITIHVQDGTYQKYGSLTDEQNRLSPYGFIKCSQSCLVSVGRIKSIDGNTLTLKNNIQLHMSQRYAPKILAAFSRNNISNKL